MSRSPFAYPLVRNIDSDAGGAADLQTDIMRFMAILALCLMAIFALVQSIPLAPVEPAAPPTVAEQPVPEPVKKPVPDIVIEPTEAAPAPERIVLTRPVWKPAERPTVGAASSRDESAQDTPPTTDAPPTEAVESEQKGFTLRFESDQALMRLVATSQVGLYALSSERAQRMTVASSRISFWDASTPNAFHEMEATTVPRSVVDALVRSGTPAENISWGVTLPGKLRGQLDELMRDNSGGSLLIGADGRMRLEAS